MGGITGVLDGRTGRENQNLYVFVWKENLNMDCK